MKAISTRYKGYRFRSRLEARWAVFFDAMGIRYRYEVAGYDLGDGLKYLPDFWLPHSIEGLAADGWGFWAEIKPCALQPVELEKMTRLVVQTKHNGLVFQGDPWPGEYSVLKISGCHPPTQKFPGLIFTVEESGYMHLANSGFGSYPAVAPCSPEKLQRAFSAARGARFEFGEKGGAAA